MDDEADRPPEDEATAPDDGAGLAKLLARRMGAVEDGAQRAVLLREFCVREGAERSVAALQALMTETLRGRGRDAWLAVAVSLCRAALPYEVVGDLYRAAVAAGHEALRLLLIAGDQTQKAATEADFDRDEVLEGLTLGERKAKARLHDHDLLLRLLYDAEPAVVRILLGNRRLTERDVLRLASRRPNRTPILREIAAASGWISRAPIQRALVLNPYAPAGLAVTLLPLLGPAELEEVARDSGLHPIVVHASREVLALRGWREPVYH